MTTAYFDEGRVRTRFDLEMHLSEGPDGELGGRLLYALDLFEPATADLFVAHYLGFLRAVAREPGQRLSQVPIFSADDLDTILTAWGSAD
jgi:pipecolate-incorporating enzyme